MEIELSIDRFCIETTAKKKYELLIKHYFKLPDNADEKKKIEESISGLKQFLETADFSSLRASYIELDKGGNSTVLLKVDVYLKVISLLNLTTHFEYSLV